MSSANSIGIIGGLLLLIIVIVLIYNQFVKLRQRVNNAWSQIEVQLKRRYDLIPTLVDTVKEYASHEQQIIERVTIARTEALSAKVIDQRAGAENMLSNTLKNLFAVAENYPQLKANENFCKLQDELSNTESQISFARQFYNDTVQKYNTKIEIFPNNIFAGIFNFQAAKYFNLNDNYEARHAVNVDLS
jgi:LemA protein